MKISIVTVNYGGTDPLVDTLRSIDSQDYTDIESIVVASGLNNQDEKLLKERFGVKGRTFIINEDSSLYDAMNIGLNMASGNAIIFMNSGDKFFDFKSCSLIERYYERSKCLIFRTLQTYENLRFVRPKLEKLELLSTSPGHQGFVAPLPEAKGVLFESDSYPVGADFRWMKKLLKLYSGNLNPAIIACFELGGISNLPSIKLAKIKLREKNKFQFIKILLKFILFKALGAKRYYVFVYSRKYECTQKL